MQNETSKESQNGNPTPITSITTQIKEPHVNGTEKKQDTKEVEKADLENKKHKKR